MSNRLSRLTIDLGGEQILLQRAEAVEGLSRPYTITVDLISAHAEIDLLPHLGKPAVVSASDDDGSNERYFHGVVTEGEFLSETTAGYSYRLVLRPFTYFMGQNRDYAIFQDQTAVDIIKKIFEKNGATAQTSLKLSGSPAKRVYCVQYGESDWTFISRLMEEEGIYYYYTHEMGKHTLVLCDNPGGHAAGKSPTLTYNSASAGVANVNTAFHSTKDFVHRWLERVATGGETKVTMRDFDFEKPQKPLETKAERPNQHPRDAVEVYEWPGPWATEGDGAAIAKVAIESRRAERRHFSGESQLISIECGTKISLAGHPNGRYNRGYIVSRTHHVLVPEQYRSGGVGTAMDGISFEAIPDDASFRAPRVTPRPVVRGPETAIVTGPSGETIYTDKYGRVKVRFHWDRGSTAPESSTCWIRVSQTGGLGNIIMPRVGHEVIVDFLDGDPDRPLVVGRVFNAENMPIYPLPANKTRALWRTKSYTSGGGSDDVGAAKSLDTGNPSANELRFEDMIGKEELFLHAQRDMTTRIRRNETHFIGLDQDVQIHGARKVTIDENDTLDVKKAIKVTAGTTIEMEAQTSITFKVGQNTIKIDQMGVTVTCTMLKMEAKATADIKSPMTTVKGDGMLTLKGGITMIN